MGLAAAKQHFEQMICSNKVQPINKADGDGAGGVGAAAEANAMGLELDENGIPAPVKRMAWNMVPKTSKLGSWLEICQRPPERSASSSSMCQPAVPPASSLIPSDFPELDESITATAQTQVTTKIEEVGDNVLKTGPIPKVIDEAEQIGLNPFDNSEASEMIEELDPRLLVGQPSSEAAPRLPDAISEVSSIIIDK